MYKSRNISARFLEKDTESGIILVVSHSSCFELLCLCQKKTKGPVSPEVASSVLPRKHGQLKRHLSHNLCKKWSRDEFGCSGLESTIRSARESGSPTSHQRDNACFLSTYRASSTLNPLFTQDATRDEKQTRTRDAMELFPHRTRMVRDACNVNLGFMTS